MRAPRWSSGVMVGLFWLFLLPLLRPPAIQVITASSDDLFDDTALHDVRILMHTRDLALLRLHYGENTFYPADLIWQHIRVRNVGVRSRGFDSRSPVKLGLLIDVDHYTRGQTFLGLRSLVLDNLRQDPAMMREPLAMAVFARMQQPAPREALGRVFINTEYQGVYALVEDIDPVFLSRTFGRADGYLFEYHWLQPFYGDYVGDDLGTYVPLFEARSHESEAVEALYEPIRAMFAGMNTTEPVTREQLESLVDLDQLVSVLAIEMLLGEEDGLTGVNGMNNFYLYREPGSLRHSVIMWDRDRALTLAEDSIFQRLYDNALTRRALSFPDLFDRYLEVLDETARSVSDSGWLAAEVERLWTLIRPAVHADSQKPFSNDEFEAAVDLLRECVRVRPARVMDEVAAARRR